MTFQHGDNWRCDETCDHPARSPDSPDHLDSCRVAMALDTGHHRCQCNCHDRVIWRGKRDGFGNPPRSPDSPDPTRAALDRLVAANVGLTLNGIEDEYDRLSPQEDQEGG
jgi:hypothetical protein